MVHEREGHAYIRLMRARREQCELAEKALQQQQKVIAIPVTEDEIDGLKRKGMGLEPLKAVAVPVEGDDVLIRSEPPSDEVSAWDFEKSILAREVIQFFDEGFAYWTTVKAVERVKSDKKRFGKYGQTRIDAWSPLDGDPRDVGEESESERYGNDRYRHNSWNGLVFYSEIEKRFGESAVPLAAKACLDAPLKELVDGELAHLYTVNLVCGEHDLAGGIANKATSRYASKKLAELSAVLKPVENDSYKCSLLAEIIRKGEDACFGPKEPLNVKMA